MANAFNTSGTPIRITQRTVVLAPGVSTEVAPLNNYRCYFAMVNIDTGDAWLGLEAPAVVNQGWPMGAAPALGKQGGGVLWEEGAVPRGPITAICISCSVLSPDGFAGSCCRSPQPA